MLDNRQANFVIGLVNSIFVSSIVTISVVFFSTLAGFALAKLRFRGANALLLIRILTTTDYVQIFTGTALAIVPLLLVFAVFGRQIIRGIMEGAVKA